MAQPAEPSIDACIRLGLSLVGYRGSGKSTVGREVARRLGREFVDLDVEIEREAGCSIAAMFAEHGEAYFRDLEERMLRALRERLPGCVLATGGGVVLRAQNREALREHGPVIWLRAAPSTLVERLHSEPGDRPSLTGRGLIEEVEEILAQRESLYRSTAHWAIETSDRSPGEVADEVVATWSDYVAASAGRLTEIRELGA